MTVEDAARKVAACLERHTPNHLDRKPESQLVKDSREALDQLYEVLGDK